MIRYRRPTGLTASDCRISRRDADHAETVETEERSPHRLAVGICRRCVGHTARLEVNQSEAAARRDRSARSATRWGAVLHPRWRALLDHIEDTEDGHL